MADLKLISDHLDICEITFTNLLLLGFDVEAKEAEYKIPFKTYVPYLFTVADK